MEDDSGCLVVFAGIVVGIDGSVEPDGACVSWLL